MVLNNPSFYDDRSDDDGDLDPWEFINDDVLASQLVDTHGDEMANQGDASPRTPNVDDLQLNENEENISEADVRVDESGEGKLEENVASTSVESHSVSANRDENSSSEQDDVKEDTTHRDTPNEENADSWIPLNAEESIPDRPESPDQHLPLPLHQTWHFITSSLREIDNQHQLRQRAQTSAKKLNRSAQNLWSNISNETQHIAKQLQERCDQADMQAREASQNIKQTASSAKDNLCRLNSEYKIHEKVAAVAAVSGAILVAAGNPRAGAGSLLVAGGALAAGEAMSAGSERGCSTFTRDYGLREGVHLD